MIPYASRTGTIRNLAALRAAGWHLLVTATGDHRHEGFPYAIDNGAYRAFLEFQAGRAAENMLDLELFVRLVDRMGAGADWILAPDIVGEGARSLDLSLAWVPLVRARDGAADVPILLAVQDGMESGELFARVEHAVSSRLVQGLFVGGTVGWKLSTLATWGQLRRRHGCLLHVGKVNTTKRINLCASVGATSFDGTSATMFSINLPKLDGARRQPDMFVGDYQL